MPLFLNTKKTVFSIFKNKSKLSDLIPEGFTDIHSHLLLGIDDGAINIGETIELLSHLNTIGFSKCIFTPHTLPEIWDNTSGGITETFQNTKLQLANPLDCMLHHAASEYMINEAALQRLETEKLLALKECFFYINFSEFIILALL
jgi:tyrosine-protein phosphatase YwqE